MQVFDVCLVDFGSFLSSIENLLECQLVVFFLKLLQWQVLVQNHLLQIGFAVNLRSINSNPPLALIWILNFSMT